MSQAHEYSFRWSPEEHVSEPFPPVTLGTSAQC
jgi:hypothetical protein